jgi:hypothetical protein
MEDHAPKINRILAQIVKVGKRFFLSVAAK